MNLAQAQAYVLNAETVLNNLISNPSTSPEQITVARGRLIRAININISLENDPVQKNKLKQKSLIILRNHAQQLNLRLGAAKKEKMMIQIPEEIALKIKKISTNINEIKNNDSIGGKIGAATKMTGNIISSMFSVAKAPIITSAKVSSIVMPAVGKLIVQPLHFPGILISKFINPDSKYNGNFINAMGDNLGNLFKEVTDTLGETVRRI